MVLLCSYCTYLTFEYIYRKLAYIYMYIYTYIKVRQTDRLITRYLWAGNLSLVFSNGISVSRKVPAYDKKSKVFPRSIVCSTLSHESSLNKNKRFTTFFWNLVFCLCFHLVVYCNEFHVGLSSPCQWSVFSSKVFTEFSIGWW